MVLKKRTPSQETFDHSRIWWNDGPLLEIPCEWNIAFCEKRSDWWATVTEPKLLSRNIHTSQRGL